MPASSERVAAPFVASPAAPLAARVARVALLAALAAGPAAWLLLPALARPGVLPGAPTAGVYALLHRWWAASHGDVPARFPSPGAAADPDVAAVLLSPSTGAVGAPATLALVMLGGLVATLIVAWRYARRGAPDASPWAAAAATAAFSASPAVVAGVTSGDLDAWHGWALLVLPLARGQAALVVGAAIAVLAPGMAPAALVPAALAAWRGAGSERWWPLAGWGVAIATTAALGWPTVEAAAGPAAWFAALTPAPAPERVFEVYVGVVAVALLLGGLAARASRPFAAMGLGALALSALAAAVPELSIAPERFLHLVPLAAALAGVGALRAALPAWGPAAAVWVATALVAEGWKGVAAPVPLTTAPLAAPAPVEELAEGPVLDLPATRGAIRRALWAQALHGRAVASDVHGLVDDDVARLAATLSTGACEDPAALGFTNVVVRREGVFRELGGLVACLGEPTWDDGAVAVWRLSGGR